MNILVQRITRWLPLLLMVGYLLFTYAVFHWGPIDWKVADTSKITLFLIGCVGFAIFGYLLGLRAEVRQVPALPWRTFFWIGGIASLLFVVPTAFIYTNKFPWDAIWLSGCQNAAYLNMIGVLNESNPQTRMIFAMMKAVFAPFVFAVLPLAVLHWSKLRPSEAVLLALHLLAVVSISLLRGTDKEIGDIIMVLLAAIPLVGCRVFLLHNTRASMFYGLCFLVAAILVGSGLLFMERKDARMHRSYPVIAAHHDGSCSLNRTSCLCAREKLLAQEQKAPATPAQKEVNAPVVESKTLPVTSPYAQNRFGKAYLQAQSARRATAMPIMTTIRSENFYAVMAASYLGQGYHGLSLALHEPFTSTYGLGHSPLLMNYLGPFAGHDFAQRAYTAKISDRWDAVK